VTAAQIVVTLLGLAAVGWVNWYFFVAGSRSPRKEVRPPGPLVNESCTIPVSGMTCAACSARVQRTLEQTPGVAEANVNLMTGSATVAYDPVTVTPERLVETIRSTGYGAELPAPEQSGEDLLDAQDRARAAEVRALRGKFAVAMTAAVLGMALGMADHNVSSADRYLLLALTIPVIGWAGRHFFTRARAAFRHHGADMNTLIAVGTGAAFLYSAAVTLFDRWFIARGIEPHVYYEAVMWIIGLVLLGNLLEARAKSQTSGAIRRLMGLRPATARVVRDGREQEVPLAALRPGDEVVVRPGETVPADGTISTAPATWTSRCSRASRSRCRSRRATGSSAPRSTGTAPSITGWSAWAATPCSPASSAWCSRHRAPVRRSSGWPTGSRRCSCLWYSRLRSRPSWSGSTSVPSRPICRRWSRR
jgi:copper chaperone CopZ